MFVARREKWQTSPVGAKYSDISPLRGLTAVDGYVSYKHPAPNGASQTTSGCPSPQPETPSELTRRATPPPKNRRARADSLRQTVVSTLGGWLSSCGPPSIRRLATATHSSQM